MDELKITELIETSKKTGQLIAYEKILRRITQMLSEYDGQPTARIILTEIGDYTCFLSDSVKQ